MDKVGTIDYIFTAEWITELCFFCLGEIQTTTVLLILLFRAGQDSMPYA